jgi:hypothetical protein
MLHMHKRILAVLAACVTSGAMSLPESSATTAPNPAIGQDITATLTAKHGNVFKRAFRDWNREQWGEPETADVSDQLREGMQLGTGNESWAEVTWPNVKTRAWANTVFAVAPNKRLVYLTGGEMLFRLDKNRKDKDDYYIWTKVLQARIRGTTVLVQAKGPVTRFTVMEGTVEITNRLDKSRAILKPGAVYEIKGYNLPQSNDTYKPTPLATPKDFDNSIQDITYDAKNYLPLYQDKFAITNLFAANSNALTSHPLLTVNGTIDSMSLIQEQQKDLPGYNRLLPIKLADLAHLNKVVFASVEPTAVPSKADYFIGQSVGKGIKLPAAAYNQVPPKGMVLNPSSAPTERNVMPAAAIAPKPVMPPRIPGLLLDVPSTQQETSAAKVFDEDPTPLPTTPFGSPAKGDKPNRKLDLLQSTQVPTVVPTTCLTPTTSGALEPTAAFQPMPGSMPANPVPTINGVLTPGMTPSSMAPSRSDSTKPAGDAASGMTDNTSQTEP